MAPGLVLFPRQYYLDELASERFRRIFLKPGSEGRTNLGCVCTHKSGNGMTAIEWLKKEETNILTDSTLFFFIKQEDSHGRLLVSITLFKRIFVLYQIFPQFLNYLESFGFRTRASDEDFGGYHRRLTKDRNTEEVSEFCYNIRYPAKHDRQDLEDPWSGMRHMAIYHKYDMLSKTSRWLLLHPSEEVKASIVTLLNERTIKENGPFSFHLAILLITARNWRNYLNYLEEELYQLETRALLAKAVRRSECDWEVTFGDTQKLQRLRSKLLKVQTALRICLDVSNGYKIHCTELKEYGYITHLSYGNLAREIELYRVEIRSHQQTTRRLLAVGKDISEITFQLLAYGNSLSMKHLATAAEEQNEKSRKESKNVKKLTFVGMLYLPATLVATVFSSNLVRTTSDPKTSHFILSSQFWLYPLATIILMVFTLVPIYVWQRRGDAKAAR